MDLTAASCPAPRLATRLEIKPRALLVVVFSQVRVPEGKFGLERLFGRTSHSCLFVNDLANGWYLGLDEAIDTAVDEAVNRAHPDRIVYYGSSMGGYGALRTGLRRGDGEIHAFGPEFHLGAPGTQSRQYGVAPGAQRTLSLTGAQPYPLHLYFGIQEAIDAAGAVYARDAFAQAQIHLLQSCHASHDHLYRLNIIRRLIAGFSRAPTVELASKNLLARWNDYDLDGFVRWTEALDRGEQIDPAAVAQMTGFHRHAGMHRLAAECSAAAGDYQAAVEWLHQAEHLLAVDPVLRTLPKRWQKGFPFRRAEFLWLAGHEKQAVSVAGDLVRHFPHDPDILELAGRLGMVDFFSRAAPTSTGE